MVNPKYTKKLNTELDVYTTVMFISTSLYDCIIFLIWYIFPMSFSSRPLNISSATDLVKTPVSRDLFYIPSSTSSVLVQVKNNYHILCSFSKRNNFIDLIVLMGVRGYVSITRDGIKWINGDKIFKLKEQLRILNNG